MSESPPPIMQQTVSPHGLGHQLARALWWLVQGTLFRYSPRPLHRWRTWLLRAFGADMHATARVYPRARVWAPWNLKMERFACVADDVDVYTVATITIREFAIVSQYGYLCGASHDFNDVRHPLTPAPITIGRRCWLAADVFVGPGVSIGEGAVVGARSSVFSDLPPWSVCVGTPAKPIRSRGIGPAAFGEAQAGAEEINA